jgi:HEAT repeat protein
MKRTLRVLPRARHSPPDNLKLTYRMRQPRRTGVSESVSAQISFSIVNSRGFFNYWLPLACLQVMFTAMGCGFSRTESASDPPIIAAMSQDCEDVDTNKPGMQIYEGTTVVYSGMAFSATNQSLSWKWLCAINGGSPIVIQIGFGPVIPVSFVYAMGTAGNEYVWTLSVSDGVTNAQAQRTLSVEVPPRGTELRFQARSGTITAPFTASGDSISQAVQTSTTSKGGRAVYRFTITNPGVYVVQALVDAPGPSANSFCINIDAEPVNPAMIWDIKPVTVGFENRLVSWRGVGTDISAEFVPKLFSLTRGVHELIIRGAKADTRLKSFCLLKVPQVAQGIVTPPNDDDVGSDRAEVLRLFNDLRSPDRDIRRQAIDLLNYKRLGPYISQLVRALTNENVGVRRFAAAELTDFGQRAYPALEPAVFGLVDSDISVRRYCITMVGNIGPSAGIAVPLLLKTLSDTNEELRVLSAEALGKIGHYNGREAAPYIASASHDTHPAVRRWALNALVQVDADAAFSITNLTDQLKIANTEESTAIREVLAKVATRAEDNDAFDALEPLRRATNRLALVGLSQSPEFVAIGRVVKYLNVASINRGQPRSRTAIIFSPEIPGEFLDKRTLVVNGAEVTVAGVDRDNMALSFLGLEGAVRNGLNWIQTHRGAGRDSIAFWYEEKRMERFRVPYSNSYAVIVAIDDYGRSGSSPSRHHSEFSNLSCMVQNAKELSASLRELGFPKENIFELYDADATGTNITALLSRFWERPDRIEADRLFVYFGGHGTTNSSSPCLVTYDFDPDQPTLSGLPMHDITGRHFENIVARHVIVAIDACFAGLALPGHLGIDDAEEQQMRQFRRLSIIEGETHEKARNLLVSGSANQKAILKNGGIFTKALIAGLRGAADFNGDNLIQFDELSLYVKNEVRSRSRALGEIQEPKSWKDEQLGSGGVVFIRAEGTGRN